MDVEMQRADTLGVRFAERLRPVAKIARGPLICATVGPT